MQKRPWDSARTSQGCLQAFRDKTTAKSRVDTGRMWPVPEEKHGTGAWVEVARWLGYDSFESMRHRGIHVSD